MRFTFFSTSKIASASVWTPWGKASRLQLWAGAPYQLSILLLSFYDGNNAFVLPD